MPERSPNLISPTVFVWLLRIVWVGLAVAMGFALAAATDDASTAAALVPTTLWWATVASGVVALVVPSPVGLTIVRMVAPATLAAAVVVAVHEGGVGAFVAIALAVVATLLALSAEVGEAMAQGAAYGSEHRFLLRPPAALLLPMGVTWAMWATLSIAGATLVAHEVWPAGAAAIVVAVPLTWWLGVRFHRFARRWLVLVPAGLVVHDPVVLGDTLMIQRANVARAGLALSGTEAADLTGPAGGHAIDIAVGEMVLVVLPASADHPKGRAIHVQSFLVAPSRPGRALQAMGVAGLPVR